MDEKSVYKSVFDLGARIGSLEGYLYVGEGVEAKYLPGWLDNIKREFDDLPLEVRKGVASGYFEVLRKVAAYLERLYGEADPNARSARAMVAALKDSGGGL